MDAGSLFSYVSPMFKTVEVEEPMMVQSSPEKDLLREGIFSTHLEGAVTMTTAPIDS